MFLPVITDISQQGWTNQMHNETQLEDEYRGITIFMCSMSFMSTAMAKFSVMYSKTLASFMI